VTILVSILGLALLMVIHEGGHLLAARAFGMRVIRFSIGFGPALWRHQPKGSDTVYQIALIPFLATCKSRDEPPSRSTHDGQLRQRPLSDASPASWRAAQLPVRSVFFFVAFLIGGDATKVR
jgi:regulator of sigma E protease